MKDTSGDIYARAIPIMWMTMEEAKAKAPTIEQLDQAQLALDQAKEMWKEFVEMTTKGYKDHVKNTIEKEHVAATIKPTTREEKLCAEMDYLLETNAQDMWTDFVEMTTGRRLHEQGVVSKAEMRKRFDEEWKKFTDTTDWEAIERNLMAPHEQKSVVKERGPSDFREEAKQLVTLAFQDQIDSHDDWLDKEWKVHFTKSRVFGNYYDVSIQLEVVPRTGVVVERPEMLGGRQAVSTRIDLSQVDTTKVTEVLGGYRNDRINLQYMDYAYGPNAGIQPKENKMQLWKVYIIDTEKKTVCEEFVFSKTKEEAGTKAVVQHGVTSEQLDNTQIEVKHVAVIKEE